MPKLILLFLLLPVVVSATPLTPPAKDPCVENISPRRDAIVKAYLEKIWSDPRGDSTGQTLESVIVGKTPQHESGAMFEIFSLLKFKTNKGPRTYLGFLWLDAGKCEVLETDPFHYPQALLFQ